MIPESRLRSSLVLAFLLLVPFQDTGLSATPLGHLGTSFSVLPLLGILALDIGGWLADSDRRLHLGWCLFGFYGAFVTFGYIAAFGTTWGSIYLPVKAVNLTIEAILAVYVVFGIDWSRTRWLHAGVKGAFAICILGVLCFDLNLVGLRALFDNRFFHFAANPDTRWHGFSPEVSILSASLGALGLLSAALARHNSSRIIYLAVSAAALALCGSKGGFVTLALAILGAALLTRGRRLPVLAALLLLSPVGWFGLTQILNMTSEDAIRESTTFATRSTMAMWTWEVVSQHPFGVGFGGFYPSLTRYLPSAMDQASQNLPILLNFSEVRTYMATARYAGTKSFLLDFAAYFGFPFVVMFLGFVAYMARNLARARQVWLLVALLFATLALSAYTASLVIYPTFVVLGICRASIAAARRGDLESAHLTPPAR